mmetsp:Transcript_16890/g.22744  ORF Transcript_16890/g.22744 Transcript_16890/m.22744 type:complete len:88 (-) Transcript_16890:190-453(-)
MASHIENMVTGESMGECDFRKAEGYPNCTILQMTACLGAHGFAPPAGGKVTSAVFEIDGETYNYDSAKKVDLSNVVGKTVRFVWSNA